MNSGAAASEVAISRTNETQHIHPSSIVDPSVRLAEDVIVGANVVIERGVRIGPSSVIEFGCYIGEDCVIGENSRLRPMVTLREKTQIGARVIIESGVVIGSDGFGYAKENDGVNYKVPQVGYVVIKDDVRIGAYTAIDRATLGQTVIEQGALVGGLVQVGHNVQIGENSTVGDAVGICGSCKIGAGVSIGQGVGMVGHIRIGDGAIVKDGSGVSKDIRDNAIMVGAPAMAEDQYRQFNDMLSRLPEFIARLKNLEAHSIFGDSNEDSDSSDSIPS